MNEVDVVILSPADEGDVGERVSVSESRARQLIDGGVAVAATKSDAKSAGTDPDAAASAKK